MKSISGRFQKEIGRASQNPVDEPVLEAMADAFGKITQDLAAQGIRVELDSLKTHFRKNEMYFGMMEGVLTVRAEREKVDLEIWIRADQLKVRKGLQGLWTETVVPGKYVIWGSVKAPDSYGREIRELSSPNGARGFVNDVVKISTSLFGKKRQVQDFKNLMNRRTR